MSAAERLARKFVSVLQRDLTPAELQAVRFANREGDPEVCASHDYLDANMAMDEAWREVMGRSPRPESSQDAALWTRAWALAKQIIDIEPWRQEFGPRYMPPMWVALLVREGKLVDMSWRNNLAPSFVPPDDDPEVLRRARWELFVMPNNRKFLKDYETKRYVVIGSRGGDDMLLETNSDFQAEKWVLANL